MKNDAWAEFVGIRDEQRYVFARLVANYLTGQASNDLTEVYLIGRIAGALYQLDALPYSHGAADEIHRAVDLAHRVNKKSGRPCGCGTRKRCVVDGVSPEALLRRLAEIDPGLGLHDSEDDYEDDDWGEG